jgi:hypothetical protein
MQDERLDEIARRLASPLSRRQALKAVAAVALGGVLGEAVAAPSSAEAAGLP